MVERLTSSTSFSSTPKLVTFWLSKSVEETGADTVGIVAAYRERICRIHTVQQSNENEVTTINAMVAIEK
jgi:hypothetical protein